TDVVSVLDAFGFDFVLIETVGAGQDEVEIASTALTTLLVNNPGTGDDIQALKAGIIEIADVLIVNKADHPGADTLVNQLQALLSLAPPGSRRPKILKTTSTKSEGFAELVDAIAEHRDWLETSGQMAARRHEDARHQVLSMARAMLLDRVRNAISDEELDRLLAQVAARELDPRGAAESLVAAATVTNA
ncbi:MAG TPA: hypothetical protein VFK32_02960, partial [Tepidiformaceae bacterium]|nr:hypothetical protein [Tepidiformaceae bacterium]